MKSLTYNILSVVMIFLALQVSGQGVLTFKLEGDSGVVSDSTPSVASGFSMARMGGGLVVRPVESTPISLENRSLDLRNQKLRNVPKELRERGYYSKVDLSGNKIRRIGRKFTWLDADTLLLSGNRIKKIPYLTIYRTSYVDLSDNYLEYLPYGFFSGIWLDYVDLSNNELKYLPGNFYNQNLREMSLSNNELYSLPNGMRALTGLEHLDLSENSISVFPSAIGKMKALKTLDLSGNQLKRVSSQIRRLRFLEELDLRDNELNERQVERVRRLIPSDCELLI